MLGETVYRAANCQAVSAQPCTLPTCPRVYLTLPVLTHASPVVWTLLRLRGTESAAE